MQPLIMFNGRPYHVKSDSLIQTMTSYYGVSDLPDRTDVVLLMLEETALALTTQGLRLEGCLEDVVKDNGGVDEEALAANMQELIFGLQYLLEQLAPFCTLEEFQGLALKFAPGIPLDSFGTLMEEAPVVETPEEPYETTKPGAKVRDPREALASILPGGYPPSDGSDITQS